MARKMSLVPPSSNGGGRGAVKAVGGRGGRAQAMPRGRGRKGGGRRMSRPMGY